MCLYQGVRNVSFSGNFAYVLSGWSHTNLLKMKDCRRLKDHLFSMCITISGNFAYLLHGWSYTNLFKMKDFRRLRDHSFINDL